MAKRTRGNFNPEMIQGGLRQGDNNVVQMASGAFVAGHALIYDANGNAIDAGPAVAQSVYGFATATAAAGNSIITLASPPLINSIRVYVNGLLRSPGTYTVAGAVVTLNTGTFAASDIVVAGWVTLNPTPGGITLSSASTPVAIRGTGIQASSATSYVVTFPAGTVAGDLAVVCAGHAFAFGTTPTGWTLENSMSGSNWNGAVISKVLAAGDITTGSVTVTFAGAFDGAVAIITFIGSTAGIRETDAVRTGAGTPTAAVSTTSAVLTTDLAVYFGSNRGASTDTVNRGTLQRQVNDGANASGCLYTEVIPAAATQTATFLYSVAGSGNYQAICIVKGV